MLLYLKGMLELQPEIRIIKTCFAFDTSSLNKTVVQRRQGTFRNPHTPGIHFGRGFLVIPLFRPSNPPYHGLSKEHIPQQLDCLADPCNSLFYRQRLE